MQTSNQNQTGNSLREYKERVAQHLNIISGGNYIYSDEIKSFLAYATDTICNGIKCIVLQGNVGSGKSILMRSLSDCFINPKKGGSIKYITAVEIVDKFRQESYEGIKKYLTGNLCIDEVGLEQPQVKVPYDSATENVIEYIFLKRYDTYVNTGGKVRTHIITNLSDTQLTNFYGERFMSRLELMRAKKTVLGASQDYMDYRKLGMVFHYKPFDWNEYEARKQAQFYGNIIQLTEDAIKQAIDDYTQGRKIYDAGGVKWNHLIAINDPVALSIQAEYNPSHSTFDVNEYLSGKSTDAEKCFVKWLKIKSQQ